MIKEIETAEWLKLNAKLQQKKNALRKALKDKGILPKAGVNEFDRYKYFSEAQYKEQSYDCFARKRQREGLIVWLIEFALGFRLYTDISLLKMIPKAKIFLIWFWRTLFYLIAKLSIVKNL